MGKDTVSLARGNIREQNEATPPFLRLSQTLGAMNSHGTPEVVLTLLSGLEASEGE